MTHDSGAEPGPFLRAGLALSLLAVSGMSGAQSPIPWDGTYLGANMGGVSSDACRSWAAGTTVVAPAGGAFAYQSCAGDGFAGGVQVGEDFQFRRLVLGIGAELGAMSDRNGNSSFKFQGTLPPPGTYAISGKIGPSDFALVDARIGYGGTLVLPYVTVGGLVTTGARNSTLDYVPEGASKATLSYSGGRSAAAAGWVAGGGIEIGMNGPWSIRVDYLHLNLGAGSHSAAVCGGSVSLCATLSNVSLETRTNGYTAGLFSIGINYWFDYWNL